VAGHRAAIQAWDLFGTGWVRNQILSVRALKSGLLVPGRGGEPLAGPIVGTGAGSVGSIPDGDRPASDLPISGLKPPSSSKDCEQALRLRHSRCQQIKQCSLIEHRHVELASLVELGPCLFSGNHVTCLFAD
jgi:hypothetical protein